MTKSSLASQLPSQAPHTPTNKTTAKSTAPAIPGPFTHPMTAYIASKIASLHATNDFIAAHRPSFDIVNICPSFIIGANELTTTTANILNGTNAIALSPLLGAKNTTTPYPGASVHVNDVAKVHVLALDPKIVPFGSSENFITSSGGLEGTTWDDAIEIVKKNFPEQKTFNLSGTQMTRTLKIDSSRTEEVFGIKFQGYEEQVTSVVKHYLEVTAAAASAAK